MSRFHGRLWRRPFCRWNRSSCGSWFKDNPRLREWFRQVGCRRQETASVKAAGEAWWWWLDGEGECTAKGSLETSQETLRQMCSVSGSRMWQMWQLPVCSSNVSHCIHIVRLCLDHHYLLTGYEIDDQRFQRNPYWNL